MRGVDAPARHLAEFECLRKRLGQDITAIHGRAQSFSHAAGSRFWKMNRAINLRLIALGLAVAVVGALIVLVTLNSERQARNTSARLGDVDTESFQIADRFRDKFRYAHDK